MIPRRTFLKGLTATGATVVLNPLNAIGSRSKNSFDYFGVHPFIENNPDAVFIMRTNVDVKTNAAAFKQAGFDFAKSVFVNVAAGVGAVPLSHKIVIKPNLTARGSWMTGYTVERSRSVVTDVYFVEGIIESMKTLGLPANQFYLREVNAPEDWEDGGAHRG